MKLVSMTQNEQITERKRGSKRNVTKFNNKHDLK